jgi:ABC-2 type transport system permease protein
MRASIFRIFALVRKDLLAMFKDPRERGVLIIPPLLQCLLFGYVATFDFESGFLCRA